MPTKFFISIISHCQVSHFICLVLHFTSASPTVPYLVFPDIVFLTLIEFCIYIGLMELLYFVLSKHYFLTLIEFCVYIDRMFRIYIVQALFFLILTVFCIYIDRMFHIVLSKHYFKNPHSILYLHGSSGVYFALSTICFIYSNLVSHFCTIQRAFHLYHLAFCISMKCSFLYFAFFSFMSVVFNSVDKRLTLEQGRIFHFI